MRKSFIISVFLAILFSVAGIGCATIPQTHYYILRPENTATLSKRIDEQGLEIGVKDFLIDPPYDQDQIVYRIGSGSAEVGFYTYHRWAVPLSQMLPSLAADGFRGISGIASIEPIRTGRAYTAILEGRVISLEEIDTLEGIQIHTRIFLSLRLRDGSVIWSDVLTERSLAEANTVGDIVEKMRNALVALLTRGRESLALNLRNFG